MVVNGVGFITGFVIVSLLAVSLVLHNHQEHTSNHIVSVGVPLLQVDPTAPAPVSSPAAEEPVADAHHPHPLHYHQHAPPATPRHPHPVPTNTVSQTPTIADRSHDILSMDSDPCGPGTQMMNMMRMFLHDDHCDTVLLERWYITSRAQYAGACIALILFCVVKEAVWAFRQKRERNARQARRGKLTSVQLDKQPKQSTEAERSAPLLGASGGGGGAVWERRKDRAINSVLYFVSLFMGYMAMLVVMTFNVGLIFVVITGQVVGHFIFQSVFDDASSNNTLDSSVEPECCEK